jgi:DNA polymerase-3 subunit alpha
MERAALYAQRYGQTHEAKGQEGLFGSSEDSSSHDDSIIQNYPDFPESEKYNKEKASIGFYITGHPLSVYEKELANLIDLSFGEDPAEVDFNKVKTATMCGVISDVQIKMSKKGNKFAVFNLIDLNGSGECVAFGKLFEAKQHLFENDRLVGVKGIPEENGDKLKLTVEEIYPIDGFIEMYAKNLVININGNLKNIRDLHQIKDLVVQHPGTTKVFFVLRENGNVKTFISKEYKVRASKELISNLKNIVGENNLTLN